jgi:16S rRNA (guanine527-N7)-methyltransferase
LPPIREGTLANIGASPDELLVAGARMLGICLSAEVVAAFRVYREELLRWSGRMNLTAFADPTQIVQDGFLDSLACAPLLPSSAQQILDVGTGAGFPAIPIALAKPGLEFTLVEASRKKLTFIRHLVRQLHLRSVRIVAGRVETLLREKALLATFDAAVARAVAPTGEVGRLVFPLLRSGGVFLAQVGSGEQVEEAVTYLLSCGFEMTGEVQVPAAFGKRGRRVLALRKHSISTG